MTQALAPPTTLIEPSSIDGEMRYEIVDDQLVEKAPMGMFQALIASILVQELGPHAKRLGLGRVAAKMLYRTNPAGKSQRRPDVSFVSYERWPRDRKADSKDHWDVVPDLAVEVVSPTDLAENVMERIHEYCDAGVRRVWIVYASTRQVYVYSTPAIVKVLRMGESLDGEDVVLGFALPLDTLFEDAPDEPRVGDQVV